ncbi:MAG: TDP-N-acetylfucosamine:lipid II N-acetylfucosaminyltransferase [Campylobacterales bacterium]|nr:TDP-N-acetylfucosamine:lipid II N-acetylfucosaminyltransferase [Campylobacterales bacterium]
MKYLHIMKNEKFIAPFIELINQNFDPQEHLFVVLGGVSEAKHPLPDAENVVLLKRSLAYKHNLFLLSRKLTPYFEQAEKVFLHSLLVRQIIDFLFFHPRFSRKTYWIIWGGDLYDYHAKRRKIMKRFHLYKKQKVISRLGGIVQFNRGEYELAREWYGATGSFHNCIFYPVYKPMELPEKTEDTLYIQVGNSATASNHHFEAFAKLVPYAAQQIKVVCPLSYGNKTYRERVIARGRELFGDKFVPLVDFMPFDAYMDLLAKIDIALFDHSRQQALGNIIALLGYGKKVYLRRDVTTWQMLRDKGIEVFDIAQVNLEPLDEAAKAQNRREVEAHFSEAACIAQWKNVLKAPLND